MKQLIIIVAMSLVCAGGAVAEEAQKTMVLPSKSGDVTFEHQKHIEMKNSCVPCHASGKGGKIEGFGKEMAHDICKGCHSSGSAGPTKCSGCHHK
jgi:DnaJ-class molecular chaperone